MWAGFRCTTILFVLAAVIIGALPSAHGWRTIKRWTGGETLETLLPDDEIPTLNLYIIITPPVSLMFQHISLALEIWRRRMGNVLVLTLDGYETAFLQQAVYVTRPELINTKEQGAENDAAAYEKSELLIWSMAELPLHSYMLNNHTAAPIFENPSLNKFGMPVGVLGSVGTRGIDSYDVMLDAIGRSFEAALEDLDPQLLLQPVCEEARRMNNDANSEMRFGVVPEDCDAANQPIEGLYSQQIDKVISLYKKSEKRLFVVPGFLPYILDYCEKNNFKFVSTIPTAMWADLMKPRFVVPYHHSVELRHKFLDRAVDLARGLYMKFFMSDNPLGIPVTAIKRKFHSQPLHLIFSHPFLASPRYLPPSIVFTGAVVLPEREQPSQLSSDQLHVLQGPHPVVLISFGTHAVLDDATFVKLAKGILPDLHTDEFTTQESIPTWSVIWTMAPRQRALLSEGTVARYLQDVPGRVLFKSWTTTPAVLAHRNLKLFISHCGGNSLGEALRAGVPVVGLPTTAEQPWNCAVAQRNMPDFLACHPLWRVDSDVLRNDIERMLFDPLGKAQKEAERIRVLSKEVYAGVSVAANWLDFAIRTDANNKHTAPMLTREDVQGTVRANYIDICLMTVAVGILTATVTAYKIGKFIGARHSVKC